MKKKMIASILTFTLAAMMLAGCGGNDKKEGTSDASVDNSANEVEEVGEDASTDDSAIDMSNVKLINDGVLTVGAEIGYPPFEEYADDGTTPIGYDIDLANAIAEKLGVECKFLNTSFDGILAGIDVNYDVVCSAVTINEERLQNALFSDPYIQNYQSVVVKKGSDIKIESLNDLDGKIVGVQKATTSDELISDLKATGTIDCEIIANEQVLSAFTQLDNGEIDVVLCDSQVADGHIAVNPDKYELAFRDNSEPEEFGIAMGKDNTALQEAINKAMAELRKEGFFEESAAYWFGNGAEADSEE